MLCLYAKCCNNEYIVIHGEIIYKWVIFHCHLCVPESKPSLVKHEDPRVEFSLPGWNSTMASGATECREPFIPCRTSNVDEDSNNKKDHIHSVVGLRRYAGSSGLIRRQIIGKSCINEPLSIAMLVYQKIRNRNELSTIEGKAYCNQNSEQGIVDPEAGLCYIHNNGNQGQRLFTPTPYASLRHNFWMMQNKACQSRAGDETLKNKTIFLKHSNIAIISFIPLFNHIYSRFSFFSCFVPLKTSICFATISP